MSLAYRVDEQVSPRERQGDELAGLVERHQAALWRYLRLLGADATEADDLMQESFLCAAAALRRGERLRAPFAYLCGVARNLLIAARRRASRAPIEVDWLDAVDRHVAAQPELLEDHRLDALRRCVGRLQGRARQAVEWHHVEGASHRETAARLGLGIEGVRSLLARARDALRQCIAAQLRQEEGP